MPIRRLRHLAVLLGLALVLAQAAPPDAAAAACGATVTVEAGDTLAEIAIRCGTSADDLAEANPALADPDMLDAGAMLWLPQSDVQPRLQLVQQQPLPLAADSYVVQPGDTLASIARDAGLPAAAIAAMNPHLDPRYLAPGDILRLGGVRIAKPRASLEVKPARGAPGTLVTLTAAGFPGKARLRVLAGPDSATLRSIHTMKADKRGRARVTVRIPEWARSGAFLFAVETTDRATRTKPQSFRITAAQPAENRLEVTGTLTNQGIECQALRGDDGRLYTLLGDLDGFVSGDRVQVEGVRVAQSYCMQGTTLRLRRIRDAE